LATGLIIVGDLIGAGAAQEQAVVGETPSLAARLKSLARPGALMIDANCSAFTHFAELHARTVTKIVTV